MVSKAVGAVTLSYIYWGLIPLFWKQLASVDARELLAYRVIGVLLCSVGVILLTGGLRNYRFRGLSIKAIAFQLATAAFLAINWYTFVWAIIHGQILDSSLGYYLSPIVGLMWARFAGKEKLSVAQAAAFLLSAVGVGSLLVSGGQLPMVALVIALSWSSYSFCKNKTKLGALESLLSETGIMAPFCLGFLLIKAGGGDALGLSSGEPMIVALLIACGPVVTLPLFLYSWGAKRVSMTALSMLQYLGPTVSALVALLIYNEMLSGARLFCFGMIIAAICLYSFSELQRQKQRKTAGDEPYV